MSNGLEYQRNSLQNSHLTAESSLSPFKNRERSLSRPSSRTSLRAHSPSFSLDDPVAVRNQMSTLKHNIRQQQAQLNTLETIVRSAPRPLAYTASGSPAMSATDLADDAMFASTSSNTGDGGKGASSSSNAPPSSFNATNGLSTKMKRRSSHDVLLSLAGPDSNLPIPKRELTSVSAEDLTSTSPKIQEGVPYPSSPPGHKRASSPFRSFSRNARALAEGEAFLNSSTTSIHIPSRLAPTDPNSQSSTDQPNLSPGLSTPRNGHPPPSPSNKRISLTPGGTTKVLADLQAGVVTARNALENTKQQLRVSQRSVAQLTRLTEDLKETRDRLRLENEGLNNVVARKERLLQEVLERARKAEAEAATLKAQLKTETTTSKKSIREMEAALAESTALSQKSEREYITLRDGMDGIVKPLKHEMDLLRKEMRTREDKVKAECERVGKMYTRLAKEVKEKEKLKEEIQKLRKDDDEKQKEVEKYWSDLILGIKGEVERGGQNSDAALKTANHLAEELSRLRRLMQAAGRRQSSDDVEPSTDVATLP
ncbi:hypothetical protein CVT24_008427 [Panaeolus cyanescens]|uniref:SWI5-dependent HO expression protein 3 n=1 Tax=Panaeolus cyanescens TaxID=181874 RepID=A0A409VBK9_9AGAR|nr:hypothetical protein CVT24_008427 [Panaeolus cyanescens]